MDRSKFLVGSIFGVVFLVAARGEALAQQPGLFTNLEVAVERDFSLFGRWFVFRVQEASQAGQDLNGDGDTEDAVLHLHDLEKGTTTNLEAAVAFYFLSSRWLVFTVSEALQGGQDLNGDGDAEDAVLHVLDLNGGTTTNLEISATRVRVLGRWVVFEVPESSQGGQDLNGDGDAVDGVLHIHDFADGSTTNLQVAGIFHRLSGGQLYFSMSESAQGAQDRNNDTDAEDDVVHILDIELGTITNLELATNGAVSLLGNWLLVQVPESAQGSQDLNGDTDAEDTILYVHDLALGATTNLELAITAPGFRLFRNQLVLAVSEAAQGGQDLNGDGDAEDAVLHFYDLELGTTSNFGVGITFFVLSGKWLVFGVSESLKGGRDLNGDGDAEDVILHLHNLELGTTTNLGVAAGRLRFFGSRLVFAVSESSQGGTDLNGDGDAEDDVLHVHDLELGTTASLELAINFYFLSGSLLIVGVSEASQGGQDLNGDSDAEDLVLHLHDLETGTTTNMGVATGTAFSLFGHWLLFQVPESSQGNQDLNGDGDAEDPALHVHDLETGTTTNLKLAVPFPGFRLYVDWLVTMVSESQQGGQDLNGDGDAEDFVPLVADLRDLDTSGPFFLRGDCNGDGTVDLSDAIRDLLLCFSGAIVPCAAACDTDGDGNPCTGVTDAVSFLTYLFRDGPPPPPPFPDCGTVEGEVDCETPPESCVTANEG